MNNDLTRHFFGGFVRLHILYHAAKEPICGIEMIEELGRHGYKLSPGTLYPILHDLDQDGYVSCKEETVDGKRRKNYRITAKGRKLMIDAQEKLRELFSELVEDRDKKSAASPQVARTKGRTI
jgi:DNA-binding PadR family transcriptional regulator